MLPASLLALYRRCFAMIVPDVLISMEMNNAAAFVRAVSVDPRFSEAEQRELVALSEALHYWASVLGGKLPFTQ